MQLYSWVFWVVSRSRSKRYFRNKLTIVSPVPDTPQFGDFYLLLRKRRTKIIYSKESPGANVGKEQLIL